MTGRMPCAVAAALALAFAVSGCASIYVNDPEMAKKADAADSSLQAADTLKPYSDQLANLAAFDTQEDAAVASLYVAMRNRDLADLPLVVTSAPNGGARAA